MKIFYYCSTGTHASLVAANYHLGVISCNADYREINQLPNFNSLAREEIGCPLSIGIDDAGNEIYTFGVKNENILLTNAFKDWLNIFQIANNEYKLVDLTELGQNSFLKLGIYLSLILGLKDFGGLIGAYGLFKMLPSIVEMVDKQK